MPDLDTKHSRDGYTNETSRMVEPNGENLVRRYFCSIAFGKRVLQRAMLSEAEADVD